MKVVKKDGKMQDFDEKKIASALARSGEKKHAERIAKKVARKLRGKREIHSSVVREEVIRELQSCKECRVENFANFQKAIRNLSKGDDVLENRIRSIVGKCGRVEGVYGGFRITVLNEKEFDYYGVLHEILGSSKFIVTAELVDRSIVISAR